MSQSISFRTRLLLAFVAVIVLSLVLSTYFSRRAVGHSLMAEDRRDAASYVTLLGMALARVPHASQDLGPLDLQLRAMGRELNVGLALLSPQGQVLSGTDLRFADMPEAQALLARPEIAEALAGGVGVQVRPASLAGREVVCAATRLALADGEPLGILYLTMPVRPLSDRLQNLVGGFVYGALLALLVAAGMSMLLARQFTGQIRDMSLMAEAIGRGRYEKRLRSYPGPEFAALAASINKMAENIQAQIATITTQKEQLIAILDNMKEGVMLLDRQARIRAVNRALAEIFPGIEACQGKSPLEAILEPSLQRACEAMLDRLDQAEAVTQVLQIEPKKGLVYDVGIVPLREQLSDFGLVVVFHDITRLKQLERVRRDFVANVSHELRTPLTSIKGYAETLSGSDDVDPRAKTFLEIIVRNANHMTKIVGDLLTLSKLESARLDFDMGVVDAGAAVQAAFRECEPLGRTRGVQLDNRLPLQRLQVHGDYDRLVQVFRNLIENAFRYSPEGQAVTVFHEDKAGEMVFGVSDCGPGIPREEQTKIFERFYRVEKHRMKSGGSSGLGLAIAKHIVERHGGRIWVESPARGADTGATFCFTLPQAVAPAQEPVAEAG